MAQSQPRGKFLFINSFDQPASKRSRELQNAAAKAHAARTSFPKALRKRNVVSEGQKPTGGHRSRKDVEKQNSAINDDRQSDSDWSSSSSSSTTSPPNPRTLVDVGKWEPFDTFAVSAPKDDAQKLLDYAAIITWPIFGKTKDGQNVFVKRWMWTVMESPVAFYAQVMSAAIHLQGTSGNEGIQRGSAVASLFYKAKAIEALKDDIQHVSDAPDADVSDGMIAAVLNLAVHDCMNNAVLPELHPKSPLSTYRNMHIYGRMEIREEHMKALYALVNRRGGLQAIDGAAFAAVIPPADMLFAARTGVPQGFPCRRQREDMIKPDKWTPDAAAESVLEQLGTALMRKDHPSPPSIPRLDSELLDLLEVASELTAALDHHQRAENNAPSLEVLINNRDWMVHRSLSLIPYYHDQEDALSHGSGISTGPLRDLLQEIYRQALLIYMDMVLYPIPPHARVKPRLAHSLLPLLLALSDETWTNDLHDFLVWAALMGAMGARYIPERILYIELLASKTEESSLRTWEALHDCMRRYLWWDFVCEEPGRKVWDEIEVLRASS